MRNWRDSGEMVREHWRRCFSEYAMQQNKYPQNGSELHLNDSLIALILKQLAKQSKYAKQKHPQSGSELHVNDIPIVWLTNGFLDNPSRFTSEDYRRWLRSLPRQEYEPENGRRVGVGSRGAATVACYFYEDWRRENQKRGIKDYGHRGEMKDNAARAVVEDYYAWRLFAGIRPVFAEEIGSPRDVEAFIEVVRDLMDKPKERRYPGDDATVEFLASPLGLVLELPPKPTPK
jgi:hypothetical protein